MMKFAQTTAIILLGTALLVKGIIPAFQSVGTDFANYYTSSSILVHDRSNVHRLYQKEWFSAYAQTLGSPEGGIFQPFPPATALLMVPLVSFDLATAKALWTILNLGLFALLIVALSRLAGIDFSLSSLLLLGSGFALVNNFFLGQVYLLMTLFMTLSVILARQERNILAGVFAGIFIPIKYFPACLLVLFLFQRRWSAVWSTLATVAAVMLVSFLWMGPEVHLSFLRTILLPHLDGEMANPFSATYQSWNSLLRSLFVRHELLNPNPSVDSATTFALARAIALTTPLALFIWMASRWKNVRQRYAVPLMALFTLVLLIAPATATYHFLVLSIPMAVTYSELSSEGRSRALLLILILYVGIGGVPAGMMDQIGQNGIWKVLAYPRLYLLTGLFIVTVLLESRSLLHGSPLAQEGSFS